MVDDIGLSHKMKHLKLFLLCGPPTEGSHPRMCFGLNPTTAKQ